MNQFQATHSGRTVFYDLGLSDGQFSVYARSYYAVRNLAEEGLAVYHNEALCGTMLYMRMTR